MWAFWDRAQFTLRANQRLVMSDGTTRYRAVVDHQNVRQELYFVATSVMTIAEPTTSTPISFPPHMTYPETPATTAHTVLNRTNGHWNISIPAFVSVDLYATESAVLKTPDTFLMILQPTALRATQRIELADGSVRYRAIFTDLFDNSQKELFLEAASDIIFEEVNADDPLATFATAAVTITDREEGLWEVTMKKPHIIRVFLVVDDNEPITTVSYTEDITIIATESIIASGMMRYRVVYDFFDTGEPQEYFIGSGSGGITRKRIESPAVTTPPTTDDDTPETIPPPATNDDEPPPLEYDEPSVVIGTDSCECRDCEICVPDEPELIDTDELTDTDEPIDTDELTDTDEPIDTDEPPFPTPDGYSDNDYQKLVAFALQNNLGLDLSDPASWSNNHDNHYRDDNYFIDIQWNDETPKRVVELTILHDVNDGSLTGVLDVSDFIALEALRLYSNPITGLISSNTPSLTVVNMYDCELTRLDLSESPALETLQVYRNRLTDISSLENLPNLKTVSVINNLLDLNDPAIQESIARIQETVDRNDGDFQYETQYCLKCNNSAAFIVRVCRCKPIAVDTDEPIDTDVPTDTDVEPSPCDCRNCTDCGFLGGAYGLGRVLGNNGDDDLPGVNDALEILKWIVGLDNTITGNNNALIAARIVEAGTANNPGVNDALEILKFVVGLDNVLDEHYEKKS
jgi:Leucine-rich repeat (LRR) protein